MIIKPCPCGLTPDVIALYDWQPQQKWVMATGNCCGEWMFEFRASYSKDQDEVERMAVKAWNDMPRALVDQK